MTAPDYSLTFGELRSKWLSIMRAEHGELACSQWSLVDWEHELAHALAVADTAKVSGLPCPGWAEYAVYLQSEIIRVVPVY